MIELDEKDVKQVASGRFFKKTTKRLIVALIGTMASFFLILFLTSEFEITPWLIFIPLGFLFGFLIHWERGRKKASDALIEEWKRKD